MGAVTGDLSNDDVGVYLDWNVEQLSGGGALPSMLGNKTLRDQLFPTDRMRSAIRAAWQSPEGYEFARRLARHELGRAEHSRAPVVFALREYLLQNSFSGTPTESQAAVVKDAVDGLLECLVLRGTDVAAVMGLAMAWKGNLLGFGWTSVREKVKDRPELRGVLSYMLAHRMLRLGKPQEAAKLFPAAVADAPKDSLLRRLAQQDLDLLKAGRGTPGGEQPCRRPRAVARPGRGEAGHDRRDRRGNKCRLSLRERTGLSRSERRQYDSY